MIDNRLLETLYYIEAPSLCERNMSRFVQSQLDRMEIEYEVDRWHQIYRLIPDTPLVCCHMDQITYPATLSKVAIHSGTYRGYDSTGKRTLLGADDKNGIYICLKLIEHFRDSISFIFSTNEEAGGNISTLLNAKQEEMKKIHFGLIFDRYGSSDIIGTGNEYCNDDFESDLITIGRDYGYKPAVGIISDCDALSDIIPCVNLSCGYYKHHTKKEYTVITELYNALQYGADILTSIGHKYYDIPDKTYTWNYNYGTGDTYNDADDYLDYESYFSCKWCRADFTLYSDSANNASFCPYCGGDIEEFYSTKE